MPELQFKGKEFVYNHHLTVPFRPLEMQADKGIGAPRLDGNLIIHGDNLHALKALLPIYAGKVDCVYIDPPYNTGKDGWSYSDRVDSPMIAEWLSSNPITAEDGLRHDKWLSMMWPRLQLLKELMKPGATLFVSIDDNEVASLKMMLSEILGDTAHLGTIVWKNATDNNPTNVAVEHEYIHVFSHRRDLVEPEWKSPWSDVKDALLKVEGELLSRGEAIEIVQERYARWFKIHKPQLAPLQEYDQIDADGIFTGSRSGNYIREKADGTWYKIRDRPALFLRMNHFFGQTTMFRLTKVVSEFAAFKTSGAAKLGSRGQTSSYSSGGNIRLLP